MIILSGVLVVLAIALLVTGIVMGNTGHEVAGLDGLKLIYVSIGVSIISALFLAIGVFLRRKELFGSAEAEASAKRSAQSRSKTVRQAKAKARVGAGDETPVPVPAATATDVPAETSVFVVPGRKRYHLESCRQLAGRDKEELTYVEAREEGFTACTACLPDTALAARAALTETEPAAIPPDDARSTESLKALADTADLTRSEDDPALVTRMDLPVTRLDDDEMQPAAESPAAAEIAETPRSGAAAEADASTDTAAFGEVAESTEAPSEPAAERPLARSQSFFEPLDRDTATAAEEPSADRDRAKDASRDEDDDVARPEPSAEALVESGSTTSDTETPDTDDSAASDAEEAAEPGDEPADEPDRDGAASAEDETPPQDAGPEDVDGEDAVQKDAGQKKDVDHEDAADDAAERPDLPFVRILSGTKRYHRPDCALIEDIADDADDLETLPSAEAKERGCTPCLVCQPDKDLSDDSY